MKTPKTKTQNAQNENLTFFELVDPYQVLIEDSEYRIIVTFESKIVYQKLTELIENGKVVSVHIYSKKNENDFAEFSNSDITVSTNDLRFTIITFGNVLVLPITLYLEELLIGQISIKEYIKKSVQFAKEIIANYEFQL